MGPGHTLRTGGDCGQLEGSHHFFFTLVPRMEAQNPSHSRISAGAADRTRITRAKAQSIKGDAGGG